MKITVDIDNASTPEFEQFLKQHGFTARQFFERAIVNQVNALTDEANRQRAIDRFDELNEAARKLRGTQRESA